MDSNAFDQFIVIPQRFTGREPVVISRDSIREVDFSGLEIHITLLGGQEVVLRPEGQPLGIPAGLTELLFGEAAPRFHLLARYLNARRKLNPAIICAVEYVDRKVRVCTMDGAVVEHPFLDVGHYRGVVEAVYGPEAAKAIVPYEAPGHTPAVLDFLQRKLDWDRKKKAMFEAEDEAERIQEQQKVLNRRFSSA